MDTEKRIASLLAHGFGVYELNNGHTAVADPLDNQDGYYLYGDNQDKTIKEAHEFLIGSRALIQA